MPPNMRDGKFVMLPLAERFAGKYSIDPVTGCWNWQRMLRKGYGYLKSGKTKVSAHRVSWELRHGPIPNGLWVLHRCDNPKCVNPEHLFLGTALANVQDMMQKGRAKLQNSGNWPDGERHPGAKLTAKAVEHIRQSEMRPTDYARLYGVTVATICNVQVGRHWTPKHESEAA